MCQFKYPVCHFSEASMQMWQTRLEELTVCNIVGGGKRLYKKIKFGNEN